VSRRIYGRRLNGQFGRPTLEQVAGLSVHVCPSCRRMNPVPAHAPAPETCHACGAGFPLDRARIIAAGVPGGDWLGMLPSGDWIAYSKQDTAVAVSFAAADVDDNGVQWWRATRHVDGEAAGAEEFPTLTQLLDYVARLTR
jgi:hypothetical protein